jgi:hypothetical protein
VDLVRVAPISVELKVLLGPIASNVPARLVLAAHLPQRWFASCLTFFGVPTIAILAGIPFFGPGLFGAGPPPRRRPPRPRSPSPTAADLQFAREEGEKRVCCAALTSAAHFPSVRPAMPQGAAAQRSTPSKQHDVFASFAEDQGAGGRAAQGRAAAA